MDGARTAVIPSRSVARESPTITESNSPSTARNMMRTFAPCAPGATRPRQRLTLLREVRSAASERKPLERLVNIRGSRTVASERTCAGGSTAR